MRAIEVLGTNVRFWHWYAELITRELSDDQLHWQPEDHPNHIAFCLWHAYRSEDGVLAFLGGRASVYESGGWEDRLPLPDSVSSPRELDRGSLSRMRLHRADLLEYVDAVRDAALDLLEAMSDEEAMESVSFPVLEQAYPGFGTMTRLDAVQFFSVGHVCEHLGDVQYIKGLMGLQGAPL